jgi:hypothetical protein
MNEFYRWTKDGFDYLLEDRPGQKSERPNQQQGGYERTTPSPASTPTPTPTPSPKSQVTRIPHADCDGDLLFIES